MAAHFERNAKAGAASCHRPLVARPFAWYFLHTLDDVVFIHIPPSHSSLSLFAATPAAVVPPAAAEEAKEKPPSRPPSTAPESKSTEQRAPASLSGDEFFVTTLRDPSASTQEWDPRILIICTNAQSQLQ